MRTFKRNLAFLDFFLESLSEAGFVHGLSKAVDLAFVEAHTFVADGAREGDEMLFEHGAKKN